MKIIIEDYMWDTVYFKGDKKDYPTSEDVQKLKQFVARNEGLDVSQLIVKVRP